jgi:hypothetical protein
MSIPRESKYPSASELMKPLGQPAPQPNRPKPLMKKHNGRERARQVKRLETTAGDLKVTHLGLGTRN